MNHPQLRQQKPTGQLAHADFARLPSHVIAEDSVGSALSHVSVATYSASAAQCVALEDNPQADILQRLEQLRQLAMAKKRVPANNQRRQTSFCF